MTSIAVTASVCASASEAALLVASFMQFLPRLGRESSLPAKARDSIYLYSGTPHDEYSL
jgi:hypothetical protein